MSSVLSLVGIFLVLVVTCGHSNGTHEHTQASHHEAFRTEYAKLAVPRFNMTLLVDTEHNVLSVKKEAAPASCYLIPLDTSPRRGLTLVVHIFRLGGSVLWGEFQVKRQISQEEIARELGSNHITFCSHSNVYLLEPLQTTTAGTGKATQPTSTLSPDSVIG